MADSLFKIVFEGQVREGVELQYREGQPCGVVQK